MPKHENTTLQKNFYNKFKKVTISVECAPGGAALFGEAALLVKRRNSK